MRLSAVILVAALAAGCNANAPAPSATADRYIAQPLVSEIYTADPSAHVWADGRIYIYPSHDIDAGVAEDDLGSHFAMRDYRVLSMDSVGAPVTLHDVALDIADVPWAGRQMWAPDAAFNNGTYFLYFPVKDKEDIFRIGVATSTSPTGPFTAQPATDPRQLFDGPQRLPRRRRRLLHVFRRHLGRPITALGKRLVQRRRRQHRFAE
ncbi:MAG: family 43 glycosylhydrolase [Terricaulis sp.]